MYSWYVNSGNCEQKHYRKLNNPLPKIWEEERSWQKYSYESYDDD